MFNPFDDLVPRNGPQPLIPARPRMPAPRYPDEEERSRNQAAASAYDAEIARANAERARAEAIKAQAEVQQGGGSPEFRQEQNSRREQVETATSRLLDAGRAYLRNYQREPWGPLSSIAETINLGPLTPGNQAFNSLGAGVADATLPIIKVPGMGPQSDQDALRFVTANQPRASTSDEANEVIFDNLQNRINGARRAMGLPEVDWRNPEQGAQLPGQRDDGGALATFTGSGNTPRALSDGGVTIETDPVLRGVAQRLGQMLAGDASDTEILNYMQQAGVRPQDTSINEALQFRRTPDFQQWRRRNPNTPYPVGDNFFTREVGQTGARAIVGAAANSGPGAYFINAGDALSMGTLDNLTDNPAQARAGMAAIRNERPGASLAGSISGAVIGGAGINRAIAPLAARIGMSPIATARAADAMFGGLYGAGSADEGSRLAGAAGGAVAGTVGGAAGRATTRAAGRVATGARDLGVRYLADRGIPMTVGQIAGQGGVVGRTIRSIEDKLESIPILGDAIRQRRAQGVAAFNREAFSQALEPIGSTTAGEIGSAGVETAQDSVQDAYTNALSGVSVQPDGRFVVGMRRAVGIGSRLPPEFRDKFNYIMQEVVAPELSNGALSGTSYQALRQALRIERNSVKGNLIARNYGNVLREVERSLEGLVRRRAPDVVPLLNRADQAYRRTGIIRDAVAAGQNTGEQFTPAQLGGAARTNAKKFGGTQGTTQQPFHELHQNAQGVLPSTIPNSGTTDRAWIAAALPMAAGGAGAQFDLMSPEAAALMSVLGLPFTRTGQQAFQKLLVSRPEVVRRAGERLIAQQGRGGRIGAGTVPMLPNYSQ